MDVEAALKGTEFEDVAADLAKEFKRANITRKNLHNAPLKVRTTFGADIYKVMEILGKSPATRRTKKAGGK